MAKFHDHVAKNVIHIGQVGFSRPFVCNNGAGVRAENNIHSLTGASRRSHTIGGQIRHGFAIFIKRLTRPAIRKTEELSTHDTESRILILICVKTTSRKMAPIPNFLWERLSWRNIDRSFPHRIGKIIKRRAEVAPQAGRLLLLWSRSSQRFPDWLLATPAQ